MDAIFRIFSYTRFVCNVQHNLKIEDCDRQYPVLLERGTVDFVKIKMKFLDNLDAMELSIASGD